MEYRYVLLTLYIMVMMVISASPEEFFTFQRRKSMTNISKEEHWDDLKYITRKHETTYAKRDIRKAIVVPLQGTSFFSPGRIDKGYYGQFSIGGEQKFWLHIDTGSSATWVAGNNIQWYYRRKIVYFPQQHCEQSSSSNEYSMSPSPFFSRYSVGWVNGYFHSDFFATEDSLNNKICFKFGIGVEISEDFQKDPAEGMLGLAYNLPFIDSRMPSFFQKLLSKRIIPKGCFGLYLARESLGEVGSNLILGGYDERYAHTPNYNPIILGKGWSIRMESVNIDQYSVLGPSFVIIDTGSSVINFPANAAKIFYNRIPGHSISDTSTDSIDYYYVPCHTFEVYSISFTFNEVQYKMSPMDLNIGSNKYNKCKSTIVGNKKSEQSIIGVPFLKNVYTVFDVANSRIGFTSLEQPSSSGIAI